MRAFAILAFLVFVFATCASSMADTVGLWDWTEPNPLENRANPGTNDATLIGGATATGAVATVAGVYPGKGDLISLGYVEESYGADVWTWTFDDVVFHAQLNHVLAGSLRPGFATGTWGYVQMNNGNPTSATATIRAWGEYDLGNTGKSSYFGGLTVQTDTAYDMQYFFDRRNAPNNVGFRMRDGASTTWGPITWKSNGTLRMTSDKGFQQEMLLGKYQQDSSVYGSFSVGETSFDALSIPEPSSCVLLLAGGIAVPLVRRRRSRR
ncbi:MAG: PEP-CTERM sorting domain-containing protein [Planctomycetota bacterium]